MHYFTDVIKKYAVFSGRASRKEYWMFMLYYFIIFFILGVLTGIFSAVLRINLNWIVYIISLAILLPTIGVNVRRLHDINRSGWWVLLSMISGFLFLIGFTLIFILGPISYIFFIIYMAVQITFFVFLVTKGTIGENKYGLDPYGNTQTIPASPTPSIEIKESTPTQ